MPQGVSGKPPKISTKPKQRAPTATRGRKAIAPKRPELVANNKLQKKLSKAVNDRFEEILVNKASQHKSLRVLKQPKPTEGTK